MPKVSGVSTKSRRAEDQSVWSRSVVAVDGGRGFVIQTKDERRLVLTAAHCLLRRGEPHLPLPFGGSYTEERTYPNLLGPLAGEQTVWAECLFVDPVADLAVLGSPDNQDLFHQAMAYDELMDEMTPLALGTLSFTPKHPTFPDGAEIFGPPIAESEAWLLALSGHWFSCRVVSRGVSLSISDAAEGIRGGMSGSPIVNPDGRAIGVVCISGGVGDLDDHREGGPNPFLPANLPGWLASGLLKLPRRQLRQKRRT